jgi:hypothetical protein
MRSLASTNARLLCPSAQPDSTEAVVFGIASGTVDEPRMIPLAQPQPVTDELLALSSPVNPLRFSVSQLLARNRHVGTTTACSVVSPARLLNCSLSLPNGFNPAACAPDAAGGDKRGRRRAGGAHRS